MLSSLRQGMKPEEVAGKKKTASLNMETDSNKLWRLAKKLNGEENRHAKIALLQDREMVHGNQAAKIFADTYKESSNILVEIHKHNMCAQNRERLLSLMMCQQ